MAGAADSLLSPSPSAELEANQLRPHVLVQRADSRLWHKGWRKRAAIMLTTN
jgi:hypothetical protein